MLIKIEPLGILMSIVFDLQVKENSDEKDMLVAWTEFLKNPESEKVRKLEMSIDEIKEAKDELVRISNDDEQRMIYEMRSKILKDKVSALNKAKNDGMKQGIMKTAKNLLKLGMDISIVKEATKLSEKEVINIKKKLEKENNQMY